MHQKRGGLAALKGVGAALALAFAFPALPQAPAVQTPLELRFDIARYRVEGNTLLPAPEIEQTVAPFAGPGRDFGDVQRALEALEAAYRLRGYSAVQVYLPEQDLVKGEVTLRVIESKIKNVQVRGNKFFGEANVRASLPSLVPGESPNANAVAKNLRLVNENPAKQTNVTLRAGAGEGEVDAVVEVADENPRKWFVSLDNTGTGATGYHRLGFGYQNASLGGSDDAMTLQYVTSIEKPSQVSIYSVGYRKPFYTRGTSLDLVAGYSDVDAGTTQIPQGPLQFSGRGGVLGARYNWQLERIAGYDHKLSLALDHRMYRNSCTVGNLGPAACGTAGATFNVTPLTLGYGGSWIREKANIGIHASASANLGGGSRGDTAALDRARFGADAGYMVYRFGASYARALAGDWQVRARLDAQYANEPLVPPEQFGIGGAASVRGFLERERADDRGHSGSLELYTPELAPRLGWAEWNLRLLAFYDFGRTTRVEPQPGDEVHNGIASAGIGLRLARQKSFGLRFDLAQIVDPGGTRERNHHRFNFGAVWSF
ncbi:MAG: ShlB/FhaC/HecB family hemolysin secretion/activation protein [Betaproteobacteria bacterium]|nr:MAG: ShlB/FhaC/HecB family hemolysin secretion/activation protein [Betaproteobacteria bacterium]